MFALISTLFIFPYLYVHCISFLFKIEIAQLGYFMYQLEADPAIGNVYVHIFVI